MLRASRMYVTVKKTITITYTGEYEKSLSALVAADEEWRRNPESPLFKREESDFTITGVSTVPIKD